MDPSILYEDESIAIVDKPAGVSVHRDGRHGPQAGTTLADWFAARVPSAKDVGEPFLLSDGTRVPRPGIVHRLDKGTSGVIALAKTQDAFLFLKRQFQERRVRKIYRAFLWGELKEGSGTVALPIGRSRTDFRRRSAERAAKPPLRDAVTEWRLLRAAEGFSYVEAKPKTGRMHQLRVHFKALQHPIVCDALYAPRRKPALGFVRLALHALRLSLTLPDGTERTFEAPLPADFLAAERALGFPG